MIVPDKASFGEGGAGSFLDPDVLGVEAILDALDAHAIVAVTDRQGVITYVNDQFCAISQYSRDELLGQTHRLVSSGRHPRAFWESFWTRISRGEIWKGQICNRAKDGSNYWVESTVYPIRDAKGEVAQYLALRTCITREKQAQQQLRLQQRRFEEQERASALLRNLLDSATAFSIVATDTKGVITIFNKGAERLLGYEAEEMLGRRVPDAFHAREEIEARAKELGASHGRPVRGFEALVMQSETDGVEQREWSLRRKDGSPVAVSLVVTPIRSPAGTTIGYLGIGRDITIRKQAEAASLMSEQRFRGAFEASRFGMAIVGLDGSWLEVNRALQSIVGYSEQQLLGMTFQDLTHPDDLQRDLSFLRKAVAGGRSSYKTTKRYYHAGGRTIWVSLSVSVVRDASGQPLYFVSQIEDITEQRALQARLRAANERLGLAARASGIGIWDWDVGRSELIWDDQMRRLYGIPSGHEAVPFATWIQRLHPNDRPRVESEVEHALDGEADLDTEFRVMLEDGRIRYLRAMAIVRRDELGRAIRLVGTNWDISEAVQQREDLARLAEEAKQASKAKSQFLANMSHEIRTPMNGIIGMSSLLLETENLTTEQLRYVEVVQSSGEALLALVNDILDFSKAEAGKLELESLAFPLRSSLEDYVSPLSVRARQKGLKFSIQVSPDTPDRLRGDPGRLRQVLLNLAGNAIKFTDAGSVELRVEQEFEAEGVVTLRFSVLDTGIGISPAAQRELFEEFSQADASTSRLYGGTGLGLAISKQLVELMGGSLGVRSQLGQGSEFWFTACFPLVKASSRGTGGEEPVLPHVHKTSRTIGSTPAREGLQGRVLVAEDNAVNQIIMRAALEKAGTQVEVVSTGADALAALAETSFDIVLMDVQMPVMDGLEACRRLRRGECGQRNRRLPVIAVTAHASDEDRLVCDEAGMSGYLTKPLDARELGRLVNEHLGPARRGSAGAKDEVFAEEPVFDRAAFMTNVMHEVELGREIARQMRIDVRQRAEQAWAASESGDAVSLRLHLHSIKGLAANCGCQRLFMLAADLEEIAEQAGRAPEVAPHLPELRHQVELARVELKRFLDSL